MAPPESVAPVVAVSEPPVSIVSVLADTWAELTVSSPVIVSSKVGAPFEMTIASVVAGIPVDQFPAVL